MNKKTSELHFQEAEFQAWYQKEWKFGSSTDEARARRAWIMARVPLQSLVNGLVRERQTDIHLSEACGFLVEAGRFFEENPQFDTIE